MNRQSIITDLVEFNTWSQEHINRDLTNYEIKQLENGLNKLTDGQLLELFNNAYPEMKQDFIEV